MAGPFVSVEVSGAEQLRALGFKLRAAGSEGKILRRELLASLRAAAEPMKDAAREAARDELPKSGGLNEWVAGGQFAVRNRLTGFNAGVRITAGNSNRHFRALDAGTAWHPVFGNRQVWRSNSVVPGWFTHTLDDKKSTAQHAVFAAMLNVSRQITTKG